MNFSCSGTILMFLILAVIASTGCTSTDLPVSSDTPQVIVTGMKPITNATATIVQDPSSTIPVTVTENQVKVFSGDYSWAEYRNNITQTLPPNPRYQWEMIERIERSKENYKGTPAIHYKITTMADYPEWVGDTLMHTTNGLIIVADRYFDASTNTFLGGTMTRTIKGKSEPATDLPADDHFSREDNPSYEMGITPFGEMNITLTCSGTGSVTVPAGTYSGACKCAGNFRDGTPVTFWVVPGIPVPVQYQFPNKYLDGEEPFQSYELIGQG